MSGWYENRRVLITGGAGFIGSSLAVRLAGLGARVTVLDSMIPAYGADLANLAPVRDRIEINFSDLRDRHSLGYLVRGEEVIFSLAGQVSHYESLVDPVADLDINCRSQLSLLECCREVNPGVRLVYASTRQIYGRPDSIPVNEDHPLRPVDVNGINKLAGEMYYTLYSRLYGLGSVSLRLTNTYGPRMDLRSDTKGFAGIFIRKALKGETIRLFGTGKQRRDFNHVDDVIDALLLAGERDNVVGKAYNLGHPDAHSLLDFVAILNRHTGCGYELVPFPPEREAIDIGDYQGDFARFGEATGWSPRIALAEGLADTISFFRARTDDAGTFF